MLNYDSEAPCYDATRGGDVRADAAAAAVSAVLPADASRVVDAACGTGIVTVRLAAPGRSLLGVDRSAGMAAIAAARLPGCIVLGDVTRLPLASGSADAVTMIWLLHLLSPDDSAAALAQAARVLRPGGALITTVDKNDAVYRADDEAAALVRPVLAEFRAPQTDAVGRVIDLGGSLGLTPTADATFTGSGQGRSPRQWRERLQSHRLPWTTVAGQDRREALYRAIEALPGQDRAGPDPVYTLISLRKTGRQPEPRP